MSKVLSVEITGDDLGLYRCMLNLVDNAIKYSPAGAKVWVGVTFGTDLVDIQVQDTGPGIPEEDLPYVFESFFRGQQDESVEVGTGLGLAMVKTTVRAHGGSISAQNGRGRRRSNDHLPAHRVSCCALIPRRDYRNERE